jgi:hypothetical protein
MKNFTLGFWVPGLLGAGFLILSLALPSFDISLPSWLRGALLIAAVLLILWAGYSAYRAKTVGDGGAGGTARVLGTGSSAWGGAGGRGGLGEGGRGGDAEVIGENSSAVGGKGGDAVPHRVSR